MTLEGDAFLFDRADAGQGKHLKSAGIGQDGFMPVHECMQTAGFLHQVLAGTEVKVIGVGQKDLCSDFLHLAAGHGFDRGGGSDRHIDRGLDIAVRGVQNAEPCAALLADMFQFIGKRL